jgi:hypothetical protein
MHGEFSPAEDQAERVIAFINDGNGRQRRPAGGTTDVPTNAAPVTTTWREDR